MSESPNDLSVPLLIPQRMPSGFTQSLVLTGVGDDGLRGVMEVRSAGGYSIVQDHDSSTVFDQPSNIISAGEADEVLPTEGLTQRLIELSKS